MKGTVIVQEAGAALPYDQAAYDRMAEEQFAALVEEGLAATAEYAEPVATALEDGTTLWDVAAGVGAGQARVFRMLPDLIEISVGDTIRWVITHPGNPTRSPSSAAKRHHRTSWSNRGQTAHRSSFKTT